MKKLAVYLILTILLCTLTSFAVHRYYVSVFLLEYAPQKSRVEVTARIFADDLDKALSAKLGKKVYLGTSKEDKNTTTYIKQYIEEKVSVKINGVEQQLHYVTRELTHDTEVLYFTLPAPQKVTSVEISNNILFELYSEQQNMVHTKVGADKKSLLLTTEKLTGKVTF